MATAEKSTEMPFIFTDSLGKTEQAKRKFIRKHVMLGKNRGKTRKSKPIKTAPDCNFERSNEDQDRASALLINMRYSKIPNKVGSELSFTRFADTVEQPLLHDVLKFSFIAKRVMYPLESCIVFHRNTKADTSWFELLTSDAVYMHAAVFAAQSYISLASARDDPVAARGAMVHYSAALRLLRERLAVPDGATRVSDPTVLAVLYLALHAHFTNDHTTAKHHIEGLRKIVDTRGGLSAFNYNTKIIIELLKCDLGIALNNGTEPTFFKDISSEPLMRYDLEPLAGEVVDTSEPRFYWESAQLDIDGDLAQAWTSLNRFCSMINSAAEYKRQLPKDVLLNTMAPVMYHLLRMNTFDPTSTDEAVRLGLLVFSSHIFLSWQDVKIPLSYISHSYRSCLLNPKLPGTLSPQLLLWLLVIGSLSIFTTADDVWLIPWIRVNTDLCKSPDWGAIRAQLKTFPWVDILHDKPGQAICDAANYRGIM